MFTSSSESSTTVISFSGTVISFTGILTVTVTVSLMSLLSSALTVIVVVPSPTATRLPFSSTVTMLSSPDSYITFLLVAFSGTTVAVILSSSPLLRIMYSPLSISISVTGFLTVTVIVSLLVSSSADLTVIVAVPGPTALILPYLSTVTATVLSDSKIISFTVASSGLTYTLSFLLSPLLRTRFSSAYVNSTLSTGFLK